MHERSERAEGEGEGRRGRGPQKLMDMIWYELFMACQPNARSNRLLGNAALPMPLGMTCRTMVGMHRWIAKTNGIS